MVRVCRSSNCLSIFAIAWAIVDSANVVNSGGLWSFLL